MKTQIECRECRGRGYQTYVEGSGNDPHAREYDDACSACRGTGVVRYTLSGALDEPYDPDFWSRETPW